MGQSANCQQERAKLRQLCKGRGIKDLKITRLQNYDSALKQLGKQLEKIKQEMDLVGKQEGEATKQWMSMTGGNAKENYYMEKVYPLAKRGEELVYESERVWGIIDRITFQRDSLLYGNAQAREITDEINEMSCDEVHRLIKKLEKTKVDQEPTGNEKQPRKQEYGRTPPSGTIIKPTGESKDRLGSENKTPVSNGRGNNQRKNEEFGESEWDPETDEKLKELEKWVKEEEQMDDLKEWTLNELKEQEEKIIRKLEMIKTEGEKIRKHRGDWERKRENNPGKKPHQIIIEKISDQINSPIDIIRGPSGVVKKVLESNETAQDYWDQPAYWTEIAPRISKGIERLERELQNVRVEYNNLKYDRYPPDGTLIQKEK